MKVYLSPSNQDGNLYAYGDTNEMEQCARIAAAAESRLKAAGVEVQTAPTGQDMYKTIRQSNDWGADLHVCIHTNAGGGRGCEVYTYSGTKERNRWAEPIYSALTGVLPTKGRGLKTANFAELRETRCPAVYCECEFHDLAETARWIMEITGTVGKAIADGILKAEGINPKPNKLYRVQAGAFSVRENAEAYLDRLKKAGFDGFITENDA